MDKTLEAKINEVMSLSKADLQKTTRKMKLKGRARAKKSKLQQMIIADINHKIREALAPVHKKNDNGITMKKRSKMT